MSIHELQARLLALDEARARREAANQDECVAACIAVDDAEWAVEQAARRVAEEQQGEVAWEFVSDGWRKVPSGTTSRAAELEAAGYEVRAIRVIATTTKESSHE